MLFENGLGSTPGTATGASGELAVCGYDRNRGALVVAVGTALKALSFVVVDGHDAHDAGLFARCAFTPDGALHILYYTQTNGDLRHAVVPRGDSKASVVATVDAEHDVGTHIALAVSDAGDLHVVYGDRTHLSLRYASLSPGGQWLTEPLPHSGPPDSDECDTADCLGVTAQASPYGAYSDIALQGSAPLVAYYDQTRGNLMLASRSSDQWSSQILDGENASTGEDTGDVGQWPSLRVDSAGNPSVAYQDASTGALRYAYSSKGSFMTQVIDDGTAINLTDGELRPQAVGAFAQLESAANGQPVIYYMDTHNHQIRKAARTGSVWTTSELPTPGGAGLWLSTSPHPGGGFWLAFEHWQMSTQDAHTLSRSLGLWIDASE